VGISFKRWGFHLKGGDSIKRLGIQKLGILDQRWGFHEKEIY